MAYPHLGKFEGELYATKYIYDVTGDGCSDTLGESDGFGWYASFSGKIKGRGPFHAIIGEDSQGFVHGTYYDTAADLALAWDKLETEYDEFSAEYDCEVQS